MSEVSRSDYGVEEEKDMGFGEKSVFDKKVDAGFEAMINEPINKPLSEFEKEFISNDKITFERFQELNQALVTFNKELENNPVYDNMDIIGHIREILIRYKIWATQLRQFTFIAKEKMKEVQDIISRYYIPASELETIKDNMDNGIVDKDGRIIPDASYKISDTVKIMREGKK